jgi:hypothetical protein
MLIAIPAAELIFLAHPGRETVGCEKLAPWNLPRAMAVGAALATWLELV